MPKYVVNMTVQVYAWRDYEVEADNPDEAKAKALAEEKALHKELGANTNGVDWDIEWQERDDPEAQEVSEVQS